MQVSETAGRLKREMSGMGGLMITLSTLSPSIGVFVVASDMIKTCGSFTLIAFVLILALGVAMSLIYAELGSAFPHAGGDYALIGRILGPTAGFAALAVLLAAMPTGLAMTALGFSDYVRVVAPGLAPLPTALCAVVAVTVIAALSVRLNAWVTGVFMLIEMATLAAVAVLGLGHIRRSVVPLLIHPLQPLAHGAIGPVGVLTAAVGLAGAAYAFNGYGSAVMLGEEVVGARRKMGWIICTSLGLAALLMLPAVVGVLVGAADLSALLHAEAPIAAFLKALGGENLSILLSLAIAGALFNAMIAIALIGARVLFAAARDGVWTRRANRVLSIVHPKYGSPWPATLVIGAVGLVLCLLPIKVLITINGNGVVAGYALIALAGLVGRKSGATQGAWAKAPAHPLAPICALIFLAILFVANMMDPGAGRTGMVVTCITMAAGAGLYALAHRNRSGWRLTDAVAEAPEV